MIKIGTIKETIAKNILYYRKKNKLTQKDMAVKIGVNNSAISNWENGTNSIDIEMLFKVCKLLNISMDTVFGNKIIDSNDLPSKISPHETTVIMAYRNQPEMQPAVDRILGIEKTVGKSIGDTTKLEVSAELTPVNEKLEQQVEEYRQSLLDEAKGEILSAYYETDLNELGTIRKKAN